MSVTPYGSGPTHACAVPGCGRAISTSYLMCVPHWRLLPPDRADTLWFAWRMTGTAHSALMSLNRAAKYRGLLQAALAHIQAVQPPAKP
jgi:hypothetical protein